MYVLKEVNVYFFFRLLTVFLHGCLEESYQGLLILVETRFHISNWPWTFN